MDKNIASALVLGGILFLIYALKMGTTIESDYGEFHNIGLISDRNNYIMISLGMIALGAIFFMRGGNSEDSDAASKHRGICPYCAEEIHIDAKICKHCKSDTENKVKPLEKIESKESEEINYPAEKYNPIIFLKETLGKNDEINNKTARIIAAYILPNNDPDDTGIKKSALDALNKATKQMTIEREKIGFTLAFTFGLLVIFINFMIGTAIIVSAIYFKKKIEFKNRNKIINDAINRSLKFPLTPPAIEL